MASVPDITRMIARIEDWQERHRKAQGRAETDRVLSEAHKLLDEIGNMLTEMRRELLGSRPVTARRQGKGGAHRKGRDPRSVQQGVPARGAE